MIPLPYLSAPEELRTLTEDEVETALTSGDPKDRVVLQVRQTVDGYVQDYRAYCARLGHVPESTIHLQPRWPIEAIAMRLAADNVRP
jgi:hypothetical protein